MRKNFQVMNKLKCLSALRFRHIIILTLSGISILLYVVVSLNENGFNYLTKYLTDDSTFQNTLIPEKNSISSLNDDKWIVVTTINNPTAQIDKLSRLSGFKLLVVGDTKTKQSWSHPNVTYLSIEQQRQLGYNSTGVTPLSSYTRKNIGYLYAIQNGAQYIFDTDDDNAPDYDLQEYFDIDKSKKYGLILDRKRSDDIVVNPYAHFGQPTIWPRGYPLSKIHLNHKNNYICGKLDVSIVQQGLVNGDPDVDAIFRLTKTMNYKKPNITFDSTSPSIQIPSNTFTPYNSQNTLFHYSAFWSMYLPKTVSFRLTDIWRSYWSQRLMWLIGGTLSFYGPTATQVRNSHSYMKDYEEEQSMYTKTDALIKFLSEWNCAKSIFFDCIIELSEKMVEKKFWLNNELESIRAWLNDLLNIGYVPPKLKKGSPRIKISRSDLRKSEYFEVRYTPIFQKAMDPDNLCCTDKDPNSLYDVVSTFTYLKKFCLENSTIFTNLSSKYFSKRQPIGNYALLVTFNWDPKPDNIEFIKHIYRDYFKLIVFCGKDIINVLNETRGKQKEFDSYTFIELNTFKGYYHYYCMTKMVEMGFHVDGILLMGDDVMLKYWNLQLNYSKIWYYRKLQCQNEIRTDIENKVHWFNGNMGSSALIKTFSYFQGVINDIIASELTEKSIIKKYLVTLESNYLPDKTNYSMACLSGSDIFYIPSSQFWPFHVLSNVYRKFDVFLEIAVPTILSGLVTSANELEIISGRYYWDFDFSFNLDSAYYHNDIKHFYHPVKFSDVQSGEANIKYCNTFMKEKIFKLDNNKNYTK